MQREKRYDVFLSHNSADKPTVEYLAQRLRQEGLEPFLDKWHLVPGDPWQEALEEALDQSRTCAVFLGPEGLGPWENEEMRVALNQRVRAPDFRVIPVLLSESQMPERGRLPPFLARLTWVDFRAGLDDADAFHRLVCGIKGVAPGPPGEVAPPEEVCPFRGLAPFREEDAPFFFGREALTQWLVEALRKDRFLAVIGPSGSGKSSVVLAGLIPALRRGDLPGSDGWEIVTLQPGERPLEALAAVVAPLLAEGAESVAATRRLLDDLAADERSLHLVTKLALARCPQAERLVLVVDQFEELFTLCRDEGARRAFMDNLLYASGVAGGQTIVVLTMRADFYPRCLTYPDLAARLESGQVAVTPMTEEELYQAIELPAQKVGLAFEKGLVDAILDDVLGEPGALPLLQYALLELWQRREGRRLTFRAYHDIGGVEGAIARRAEEIYAGFTSQEQGLMRRVMMRLVQPGIGTEDTRRRATLAELSPLKTSEVSEDFGSLERVVKALADARLVTTGRDPASGQVMVEVAHEALIRGWPRLQGWLDEDRAALLIHRRLTEAAQEWERLGRDEGALLRGARLAEAEEWAEKHGQEMNPLEQEFLEASLVLQEQDHRTARQRVRRTIAGLVGALVVISVLALLAFVQGQIASQKQKIATSRELAAAALNNLNVDPERSLLLAMEAVQVSHTFEAEDALRQALLASRVRATLRGHEDWVTSAAFSPNGKWVVTASVDNTARVWEAATERELAVLQGHEGVVISAVFSPDGKWVVTASYDNTARVWEAATGRELAVLRGHENGVNSAVFSPDGKWVVTASDDNTGRVWEVATGRELAVLRGHEGEVISAAFSPNGKWVVTASWDGTARVWEAATGEELTVLRGHEWGVTSAAFSPDGKWVVTASDDDTARVWEAATGKELVVLRGHEGRVTSAAFSLDGRYIVTAGWDGTARIYLAHIEDLMELARSRVTRELTPEERRRYLHED